MQHHYEALASAEKAARALRASGVVPETATMPVTISTPDSACAAVEAPQTNGASAKPSKLDVAPSYSSVSVTVTCPGEEEAKQGGGKRKAGSKGKSAAAAAEYDLEEEAFPSLPTVSLGDVTNGFFSRQASASSTAKTSPKAPASAPVVNDEQEAGLLKSLTDNLKKDLQLAAEKEAAESDTQDL